MIWNAKSLQRVMKELERYGSESSTSDPLLFQGSGLAGPILLSLATEISLKAWQCRERIEIITRCNATDNPGVVQRR